MNSIDIIKSKIKEMYRNYGLDYEDMSEDEVARLVEYYARKKDKLSRDLSHSRDKAVDSEEQN
ncbi:hypothetical protein N9W84_01345 [bacterium]|nr:hypothetical protein [bacterium]